MKNKEEVIFSDTSTIKKVIEDENEIYRNSTPEFKVMKDVLSSLSRAYYAIKYKEGNKEESNEDALLELVEARGKLTALSYMELAKSKKGE